MKVIFIKLLLISSLILGLSKLSYAQTSSNWPNGQVVRIIVPFPGGASTMDSVVRTIVPELGKVLGSSVIVDNKPCGVLFLIELVVS